jgi:hypothetical protein
MSENQYVVWALVYDHIYRDTIYENKNDKNSHYVCTLCICYPYYYCGVGGLIQF